MKLTMFSDFICPFCYIGFETVRKLKPEFDLNLEWRGFEIHPDWPADGMSAENFHRGASAEDRRAAWARIEAMADAIGLGMKPPAVLYNSHAALEAVEFARESGLSEQFEERVYRAYFWEGRNIGTRGLISELAAEVGIDSRAMDEALESGKYGLKLKNHALAANQRGVGGVPTFFLGDFPLVGAQSEDVMRKVLSRARERMASLEA
jgi:predicted DsbA family dithiol-disulfide isomerase